MGIYENWHLIEEFRKEYGAQAARDLPPPGTWKDNLWCWAEALWFFVQGVLILILLLYNFCIWLDIYCFVIGVYI